MPSPTLRPPSVVEILRDARDIRGVARRLGRCCLDGALTLDASSRFHRTIRDALELGFANVALDDWLAAERQLSGFEAIVPLSAVAHELAVAETYPLVGHLAVLRAICKSVLPAVFLSLHGQIQLERGDPIPFPDRPTHTAFPCEQRETRATPLTPSPGTMARGSLLEGTSCRLFGGPTNVPIGVTLDFTARDALDQAAWHANADGSGSFPSIVTCHPYAAFEDELTYSRPSPNRFFGVGPIAWEQQSALEQLETGMTDPDTGEPLDPAPSIAIFPELSFPAADALADALLEAPEKYPALVVGGSAHATIHGDPAAPDGVVKANHLAVYLDGVPLAQHRKIHPFAFTEVSEDGTVERLDEDLIHGERRIVIPCGTATRLGVAICADLNDLEVPGLLTQAGVNLLLVGALTPSSGAFVGAISQLACWCQALCVIVNGTPPGVSDETPMVLAAVPRSRLDEQLCEYPAPDFGRRAVGVLNPNSEPLASALTWR